MPEIPIDKECVVQLINRYGNASFLTITLKPNLYKFSSITQLELTNNDVYKILYATCRDFICVAEHTESGNVHYHAIVVNDCKSSQILMINSLKKTRSLGFIKFDKEIKNNKSCAEYIVKEIYDTGKIMHSAKGRKPYYYMTTPLYRMLYDS